MPKRYIDSDLPNKRWFRKLSPEYKTLWIYLTLWSNSAGIIDVDIDVWSIIVGSKKPFTEEDILKTFGDRIYAYKTDKWYLPGLIDFQQKRESIIECYEKDTNNNFYKSIINTLRTEGLLEGYVEGLARGSWRPSSTSTSISNSNRAVLSTMQKEKKERLKRNKSQFELIWNEYPKKSGKKPGLDKYLVLAPDEDLFNLIYSDITERSKSYDWRKEDGKYVPLMTTYLNQERWNDDMLPVSHPPSDRGDTGRGPYIEDEEDN